MAQLLAQLHDRIRVEVQIVRAERQELIVQPQLPHMQRRQAAAGQESTEPPAGDCNSSASTARTSTGVLSICKSSTTIHSRLVQPAQARDEYGDGGVERLILAPLMRKIGIERRGKQI